MRLIYQSRIQLNNSLFNKSTNLVTTLRDPHTLQQPRPLGKLGFGNLPPFRHIHGIFLYLSVENKTSSDLESSVLTFIVEKVAQTL